MSQRQTGEREEQTDDEAEIVVDGLVDPDSEIDAEAAAQRLAATGYEITVEQTTATDDETGEQYTLWKACGAPSVMPDAEECEVSPHLPEAIMGLCDTLERKYGGDL